MDLHEELRRAQALDAAGDAAGAIALLETVADATDPFVPWIWYFAATIADRVSDSPRLMLYSRRFNASPYTVGADYRSAHVDLLAKRIVHLCRDRQPVDDDVAALMAFDPSRNEIDMIYANQFDFVLPNRLYREPEQTITLPWSPARGSSQAIRIGGPHYVIEKSAHPVPVPQLHIAHGATYITNRADGGLLKDGLWYRGLGTGPSVEQALTYLEARGIRPQRLPGRGLLMFDYFSPDNYCHWTMDWVPRALLAREFGGGFDWVFVRGTRKPFQLAWLRALGIDPYRVVFEDGIGWYAMDEFIFADNGNVAVTHPAYGGHPEIIRRLRDALRPAASAGGRRRIFISRADGGGRGLLNEADVLALVTARGFEVFNLSSLTLPEQAALFASAEAVVGVHGAGLTNVIFMPQNALVVEMLHHRYGTNSYAMPALNTGLRYAYLACAGEPGGTVPAAVVPPHNPTDFITASLWVDLAQLASAIDLI